MQYKSIENLGITRDQLSRWADSRETSEVVALAIHAISDEKRSPEEIWEDPEPAEYDHVIMAVQVYVEAGEYSSEDEYFWGAEKFSL